MGQHHRKPLIPPSAKSAKPKDFPPPLEVRRALIEEQIQGFRQQGYKAQLTIEAFGVQDAGDGELLGKEVEKLEHQRDNAYKSARMLEAKLAAMPKPKSPSKDGTKKP